MKRLSSIPSFEMEFYHYSVADQKKDTIEDILRDKKSSKERLAERIRKELEQREWSPLVWPDMEEGFEGVDEFYELLKKIIEGGGEKDNKIHFRDSLDKYEGVYELISIKDNPSEEWLILEFMSACESIRHEPEGLVVFADFKIPFNKEYLKKKDQKVA